MPDLLDVSGVPPAEPDLLDTLEAPAPEAPEPPFDKSVGNAQKREELAAKLVRVFTKYKKARARDFEPVWNLIYEAYNGVPPLDSAPHQTVYVDREPFRQVEALKPMVCDIITPDDREWCRYEAQSEAGEAAAAAATEIIRHRIDVFRLDKEIHKWRDAAIQWGTSFLRYGWCNFVKEDRKIALFHGKGDAWDRESVEVSRSGPFLEQLPIWSVYADPKIEDPRSSPFVFVEKVVSASYLKTQIREGNYDANTIRNAIKEGQLGRSRANDTGFWNEHGERDTEFLLDELDGDAECKELVCYANNGWVYVLLDEKHLVHANRGEFRRAPILTLKTYPAEGQLYGTSCIETILGAYRHLMDIDSLSMDALRLTTMPVLKARKSEANNLRRFVYGSGAVLELEDLAGVEPLSTINHLPDLQGAREAKKFDMQLASGATKDITGIGASHPTAIGVTKLQQAGMVRIEHLARLMMPSFAELYDVLYQLHQRYLDENVSLKLPDTDGMRKWQSYGPEVFATNVDVRIEVAPTMVTRETIQQQGNLIWPMISQDPRVDAKPIFLKWMRSYGMKNPDRLWVSAVTTQNDVAEAIRQHRATGLMDPAKPSDDHALWIQLLSPYIQSQEFVAMSPVSQAFAIGRQQQHLQYLQKMGGLEGQMTQMSPGMEEQGGVQQMGEQMANTTLGTRMMGANAAGAGMDAIMNGSVQGG